MKNTARLIHQKYNAVRNKLKTLKKKPSGIYDVKINELQRVFEVLKELKESMEKEGVVEDVTVEDGVEDVTIEEDVEEIAQSAEKKGEESAAKTVLNSTQSEVDNAIKDVMSVMYVSSRFERVGKNKDHKRWWKSNADISNKDFDRIVNISRLFFGAKSISVSHQDVLNSAIIHAKKYVSNIPDELINGLSPSFTYSGLRDLIKNIELSDSFTKANSDLKCLEHELSFIHRDFGNISVSRATDEHKFTINITCADGIIYKYGVAECFENKFLSYKPYKCTLDDYLKSCPLRGRRKILFDSTVLYPTTYAKGVIQGILTALAGLKTKNKHGYLLQPRNILLHDKVYHPYPPSYLSIPLSIDIKNMVFDAHEKRQYTVPVSFVHTISNDDQYMHDDVDAIYSIIFDLILEFKDNPLPPDWKLFEKIYTQKKRLLLFNEIISSYPVLWDWQKKLYMLIYACHLLFDSTPDMHSWMKACLKNLDITEEDWCSVVRGEHPWGLVWNYEREETPYKNGKVEDIIKFFRNLVTHADKKEMIYKTQAYLEHRISYLFPHLLPQINEELIKLGINY